MGPYKSMLGRSHYAIDDSTVTLQIVASLTDNSRGVIYDQNIFIIYATGVNVKKDLNMSYF
jgi:hypothetical protein